MKESELRKTLKELFGLSLSDSEIDELLVVAEKEELRDGDMVEMLHLYSVMDDEDNNSYLSMDEKFYSMIEEKKMKAERGRIINPGRELNRVWKSYFINIAAGIALFITGWLGSVYLGSGPKEEAVMELSSEILDLKETLVLTMLKQQSPAERIQAVSMAGEMNSADDRIIQSLLSVLNNDPNDNVRLIALETLVRYSDNENVLEGLIKSISRQESPLLQLRMAEIMTILEEKRSVPEFQKILGDTRLDYSIREKLNETVEVLL